MKFAIPERMMPILTWIQFVHVYKDSIKIVEVFKQRIKFYWWYFHPYNLMHMRIQAGVNAQGGYTVY